MEPIEKQKTRAQPQVGGVRPELMLNMGHGPVKRAVVINSDLLVEAFGSLYSEEVGWPGAPIRTMAGMVILPRTCVLPGGQGGSSGRSDPIGRSSVVRIFHSRTFM